MSPGAPPRIAALDGVRGVAVALVFAYHLPLTVSIVPGGTLGVDVFFVLSGFLVTSLLLRIAESDCSMRGVCSQVRAFWLRRAARLVPALFVLLLVWALVWLLTGGSGIFNTAVGHASDAASVPVWVNLRGLGATLLYGYNWLPATGAAQPLAFGHLWSLSVEEQFYLAWPIILLVTARLSRWGLALSLTATLIVVSATLSAVQSPAHGYAWAYYGTESRAQQLLLGSLLAQCWSHGMLRLSRRTATTVGAGGVLVLALASRHLDEHGWLAAHGGMSLTALSAAAVVLCVLCQGRGPATWLGWPWLRWLGRRSYAIYLWSYPLTMWSARLGAVAQAMLVVGVTLTLAGLSWRFVEQPAQMRMRVVLASRTGEALKATASGGADLAGACLVSAGPAVPARAAPAASTCP